MFLVPCLIQKEYFADIKLGRFWSLSINRDNILQLSKVFVPCYYTEEIFQLFSAERRSFYIFIPFTIQRIHFEVNKRRSFWSSLLYSRNISQLSNCEIYDPFYLLDYASDSDSVKLTTPLTSPISVFHLVASILKSPTTNPAPTTSLVKRSLKKT